MPELRKDPLVSRWVVMAPERANRPKEHETKAGMIVTSFDPFGQGNESTTTPEIVACRPDGSSPDGPGWTVRVVPNKFPALISEGTADIRIDGIYESMDGIGAHEVIIECPHNEANISRLNESHVQDLVWIYRERLVDLKRDTRLAHALIFKNKGVEAGASLNHAHSQLMATPLVPTVIRDEISGSLGYFQSMGHSVFDEMIRCELATGKRVVLETSNFLVICPFASRFPYEMCILPKRQSSHFENLSRSESNELGSVLRKALRKLDEALNDPSYNYVIHSAPFNEPELPHYRWHLEILPRLTGIAGFEWGTGFFSNEVLPERAASTLRKAAPDSPGDYIV